jgi:hypothetical protein
MKELEEADDSLKEEEKIKEAEKNKQYNKVF